MPPYDGELAKSKDLRAVRLKYYPEGLSFAMHHISRLLTRNWVVGSLVNLVNLQHIPFPNLSKFSNLSNFSNLIKKFSVFRFPFSVPPRRPFRGYHRPPNRTLGTPCARRVGIACR